jgi:hypothetical protein
MNTTSTPVQAYAQDVALSPELNGMQTWAICCSGGGIRSGSYCLGALQGLEKAGSQARPGISGGVWRQLYRGIAGAGGARFPAERAWAGRAPGPPARVRATGAAELLIGPRYHPGLMCKDGLETRFLTSSTIYGHAAQSTPSSAKLQVTGL